MSKIIFCLLAVGTFLGCSTMPAGSATDQQIRQQLAQSQPVVQHGYFIKDLRFSADKKKALVVFGHNDSAQRRDWEFVLARDEFGRYQGTSIQPFYTPGTANTPPITITVDARK